MQQEIFAPDTLFFVFEEDWRLFDDQLLDLPTEPRRPEAGRKLVRNPVSDVVSSGVYVEPRSSSHGSFPEWGNFWIEDIVSFVTAAHRHGKGDITWLTWQPGQDDKSVKRAQSIRSGAMLIAVSKQGADRLAEGFRSGGIYRGHFDCALLHWLMEKDFGESFSSYLVPPLGNYKSHISGCEKSYSTTPRPSCWTTRWVCPGTRREHDPERRDKWLAWHTKKGDPKWIAKVDLDRDFDNLKWMSFWAVDGRDRPDHALAKKVLAGSEPTAGPRAPSPAAAAAGSSASGSEPTAGPEQEPAAAPSQRERRRQRTQLFQSRFRIWTSDRKEACQCAASCVQQRSLS